MYQIKATLLLLLISLFSQSIFGTEYYKYIVQKGESLQDIAELKSLDSEYIFDLNNQLGIGLERLDEGAEIFLPKNSIEDLDRCPGVSGVLLIPNSKVNLEKFLLSCLRLIEKEVDEEIFFNVQEDNFDWNKFNTSKLYLEYYMMTYALYRSEKYKTKPDILINLNFEDIAEKKISGYEELIYWCSWCKFDQYLDPTKIYNKFFLEILNNKFREDLFKEINFTNLPYHIRIPILTETIKLLEVQKNTDYINELADQLHFYIFDHFRFNGKYIDHNTRTALSVLSYNYSNTDQPEKAVDIYNQFKKFICDNCDLSGIYFENDDKKVEYSANAIQDIFFLDFFGSSAEFPFISNDNLKKWVLQKDKQIQYYKKTVANWGELSDRDILISSGNLGYQYSSVSTRLLEHQKCELSEKYFDLALNHFNKYKNLGDSWRGFRSYAYESIYLAECYSLEGNFEKAKKFIIITNELLDESKVKIFVDEILKTTVSALENYIDGDEDLASIELMKAYEMVLNIPDNEKNILLQDSISSSLNLMLILKNYLNSREINFLELNRILNSFTYENEILNIKIESENNNLLAFQLQLKTIQNELVLLESQIEDISDKEFIKLNELYVLKQEIIKKIFNQSKRLNTYLNPSSIEINEIQAQLKDKEYLVTYTFFEHTSWAFLISNKSQHLINLGYGINSLNQDQTKLKNSLNQKFNFEASLNLYKSLFKPLENFIETESTIKILNNDNLTVPFEMFTTSKNSFENSDLAFINANWLINDYIFTRVFEINLRTGKKDFEEEFLGIANSENFGHLGLAPLTEADSEVIDLGRSSNAKKENILLRENANKEILFKKLIKTYEKIVIATHAVPAGWKGFTSEPSLILNSKTNDYFLTSSEIAQLDIAADLVILSACNSLENDLNKIYKAFLVAGANTVVYSNWQLDSTYANKFNDALFAELWVNSDLQKHEAVRNVALKFINNYSDPSYANPKFWANFTVGYGNL